MVPRFQDDSMVNESMIIVLSNKFGYAGKIEDFGIGRRENEFGRKKKHRDVS